MRGFPLPESEWFFTRGFEDGKWRIQIHHKARLIADEKAISEMLAIKRAWDKLEEYCFYRPDLVPGRARSIRQETRRRHR